MSCSGCGGGAGGCITCAFGSLSAQQARGSLAQRFAHIADGIRQSIATPFGVRAYRVFLTWTRWSGAARGEGVESVQHRVEILPTPRVSDLTAVTYRQMGFGVVPEGSLRVDRISSYAYTEDELRGLKVPCPVNGQPMPPPAPAQEGAAFPIQFSARTSFFYEVVEDGRGDNPPERPRYRLMAQPWRRTDGMEWTIVLQREDRDMDRDGQPSDLAARAALLPRVAPSRH